MGKEDKTSDKTGTPGGGISFRNDHQVHKTSTPGGGISFRNDHQVVSTKLSDSHHQQL